MVLSLSLELEDAMKILKLTNGVFEVAGDSGTRYRVTTECPEFMNEQVTTWTCSCPAAKYRDGLCKHAKFVISEEKNWSRMA